MVGPKKNLRWAETFACHVMELAASNEKEADLPPNGWFYSIVNF